MKRYEDFLKILGDNGYDGVTNESDFYFERRNQIDPVLYGPNVHSDEFAAKVRWKSERGIVCNEAIRKHITEKMEEKEKEIHEWSVRFHKVMMDDPNWETKIGANVLRDLFATIDFSGFTFGFGGRSWNLNEFTYSFPLQRASGPIDLSGIDLRGIKLRHCRFVNINFAGASFDNAQLSEIELVGSSLYRASFRGSRFQSVRCGKGSSMNGIDLTSAFVNAIFLNDKCMSTAFIYKDVSYWYLIKSTWKSLIGKPTKTEEKVNHTQFVWVVTNEMNLRETRQIKEYLIWYQDTMERIKELRKEPLYQRLAFMLSLVATKRWSSYRVLALFAFVVDLVYSLIFWITKAQFVEMPKNLVSIFYASTLIFTSLGVEGVKPGTSIAEILVVSEAIMGYLVLGLFVFLMTRMVDRQF